MRHPRLAAPADPRDQAIMQAQYYGMVSEADHQLGRVVSALRRMDAWDKTLIIVTSDHGEQLGDHGLIQKLGFFESSFHILGVIRDPRPGKARGQTIHAFTENIDWFPTLCEALGLPIPAQCDGLPLTPFLDGEGAPSWWRQAAHWEFDWRSNYIRGAPHDWPRDRRLERQNLAVLRTSEAAYVHFGDGSSVAFDLLADPTWRTPLKDPRARLDLAEAMLTWRAQHLDRTLTGMLMENGGVGRWPPPLASALLARHS
jgi:arylsulfatase A-like enzyme